MSAVDKAGRDCPERRELADGASYPVLDAAHKWEMIRELYSAGWSPWLIAQFCGMTPEDLRQALFTSGASILHGGKP